MGNPVHTLTQKEVVGQFLALGTNPIELVVKNVSWKPMDVSLGVDALVSVGLWVCCCAWELDFTTTLFSFRWKISTRFALLSVMARM
jgi:hypothetical protein